MSHLIHLPPIDDDLAERHIADRITFMRKPHFGFRNGSSPHDPDIIHCVLVSGELLFLGTYLCQVLEEVQNGGSYGAT